MKGRRPETCVCTGAACAPVLAAALIAMSVFAGASVAQQPDATPTAHVYPKEIRGYKVDRAKVEIKKQRESKKEKDSSNSALAERDELIELGDPSVLDISPLGITLAVPIKIAAVKQSGKVDFLTFEEMRVNGTPVTVEDYSHPFVLPNDQPVVLPEPIRLFISTPRGLLGALGELTNSKKVWPVTGRVYVFGRFKKSLLTFKRAVPVELKLSLPNPLLGKNRSEH